VLFVSLREFMRNNRQSNLLENCSRGRRIQGKSESVYMISISYDIEKDLL